MRKGRGEWEHAERGEGERSDRGEGERTERDGEYVMEWDWVRAWFCLSGRGERGGSSGGLKGSTRSISDRTGGGGRKSSSASGGGTSSSAASRSASSARDRWSTMPAPKESPTTLMEVRILSLRRRRGRLTRLSPEVTL